MSLVHGPQAHGALSPALTILLQTLHQRVLRSLELKRQSHVMKCMILYRISGKQVNP